MGAAEIIFLVTAVAFLILVIFLSKFLYDACKMMQKITESLEHTDAVTDDINRKLKRLDPIFCSLENVGEDLECVTSKCRQEEEDNVAMQGVDLVVKAIRLWQDFKRRS